MLKITGIALAAAAFLIAPVMQGSNRNLFGNR